MILVRFSENLRNRVPFVHDPVSTPAENPKTIERQSNQHHLIPTPLAWQAPWGQNKSRAMIAAGDILFAVTVFWILCRFYSAERPFPFPGIGHAGAVVLLGAEILLFARVEVVTIYFTPIAWTAYIAWADSAVFSLRGKSLWRNARTEFVCLALVSIPLWLIFEAYNLRLANWVYVGLAENALARGIGYAWSFATIWPAIFETATLLRALSRKSLPGRNGESAAESEVKKPPASASRQSE